MRWVMVMLVVVVGFGRAAYRNRAVREHPGPRYDPPELFDAEQRDAVVPPVSACPQA